MSRFKLKRSHVTALIICGLVAVWVISGQIQGSAPEEEPQDLAEDTPAEIMTVRVASSTARNYTDVLSLRGRTEAYRKVELRFETQGRVVDLPVQRGDRVEAGMPICRLDVADREAQLAEAEALVKQRQLEYDAATRLGEQGYRSETNIAAAKAALDAAKAQVERVEVDIRNTVIRAPFAGYVESRPVEVGDYLAVSGVCATVIDENPYLVIAEVSESDVGAVNIGARANIDLSNGMSLEGTLRYISQTASEFTRTFRVEIIVSNPDHKLREGLSANIRLPVASADAHLVSSGVLVLNDAGELGIRTVDADSRVAFFPVTIIGEDPDGVWISGLPPKADIIVVGQDFVREGERVRTAVEMAEEG